VLCFQDHPEIEQQVQDEIDDHQWNPSYDPKAKHDDAHH
jgi:hypothetical protein